MTTGFSKIYITLTYLSQHVPLTVCSLLVHSCDSRLLLWSILELIGLLNYFLCLLAQYKYAKRTSKDKQNLT